MTSTILDLSAAELDFVRQRNDTAPWDLTIRDKRTKKAINVTGFVFLLTCDTRPDPPTGDDSTRVFQITATIVDGPNGLIRFELDATQANQDPTVKRYHDIQQTDTGGSERTIAKGRFTFEPDITH